MKVRMGVARDKHFNLEPTKGKNIGSNDFWYVFNHLSSSNPTEGFFFFPVVVLFVWRVHEKRRHEMARGVRRRRKMWKERKNMRWEETRKQKSSMVSTFYGLTFSLIDWALCSGKWCWNEIRYLFYEEDELFGVH